MRWCIPSKKFSRATRMSTRRKISVRKILQFCVTVAAVTGFMLAMTAAARRHESRRVTGTDLRITNPHAAHFLDKAALEEMLFTRRHMNPEKLKLRAVDLRRLEKLARTNPWVANAQAYVDHQRVLHVRVTQRVPVVRLFGRDGSSHYLDTALKPLPVSVGYAHYIPVVTGVPTLADDSAGRVFRGQIIALVNRISRDTFWNAQVSEIAISPNGQGFELVPVLGNHRILLGDTCRLDAKLQGLFSFYKGVLNRVGWDKYTVLDARYRGQVVASPSLPWKAPIDRAATNMNWVKTIVGDAAANAASNGNTFLADSARRAAAVASPSAQNKVAGPSASAMPVPTRATQQRAATSAQDRPAITPLRPATKTPPARSATSASARATTGTPTNATPARNAPAPSNRSARPKPPVPGGTSSNRNPKPKAEDAAPKPKYTLPPR